MATIGDALKETLKGKPELPAGAVADTWYTLGVATHELHAVVAAYFLQKQGIWTRITPDVQEEHEWNHRLQPSHEKYLDSEGVPKAPVGIESILEGTRTHLAVRTFTEDEARILANIRLTQTDKKVALEAKILAQNFGHCYVITNDTDLIRQIRDAILEQNLNIALLMPSTIEHDLGHLLPELGLQLLIPGQVLAQLYKLGSGQQRYEGQPYVHVIRNRPYTFGNTTIMVDTATAVLSTGKPGTKAPSRTNDYGIPIAVLESQSQEEVTKAVVNLFPKIPKRPVKFALLSGDQHYFSVFSQLRPDKEDKDFVAHHTLQWARIK